MDLIRLLHEIDGQLGLAVHRGEGRNPEWKREADDLIERIRKAIPEVEKLTAERDDLLAEIKDGYGYMDALAIQSTDPGTGTLAWLHRNRRRGSNG